ncbi:hypothetical protein [Mycolicibacterium chubuense]|uniref:hypothetical protein n=1 Tax=Mycolicibacterium chubuense TaxID=1800 RepID=UPI00130127DA
MTAGRVPRSPENQRERAQREGAQRERPGTSAPQQLHDRDGEPGHCDGGRCEQCGQHGVDRALGAARLGRAVVEEGQREQADERRAHAEQDGQHQRGDRDGDVGA